MQRQSTSKLPTSSIRGQLEPHDHRTAKGWRYIQTTNTPNQLKVLLPPGTASMYEQLLKFEELELRKKSSLSWERLEEIRHLKDRMIRKCQKLVKTPATRHPGGQFGLTFQSVVAPADFRLKEMERWFIEQHKRTLAVLQQKGNTTAHSDSCKCTKCIESVAVGTGVVPSSEIVKTVKAKPSGALDTSIPSEANQQPRHTTSAPTRIAKSMTLPSWYQPSTTVGPLTTRVAASSRPLPHLLRVRDPKTGYDLSQDPQRNAPLPPSPPLVDPDLDISEAESPEQSTEQSLIVQKGERRQRPSCIKRTSTGDLSKRVSWADNEDLDRQVNRYTSAAREIYTSGRDWEEIRDIYRDQMSGLDILHQQVGESLEHLRSESAHLKHADTMIKLQRDLLHSTFQELERKQLLFQAKVQKAVENADRVLLLTATEETLPT